MVQTIFLVSIFFWNWTADYFIISPLGPDDEEIKMLVWSQTVPYQKSQWKKSLSQIHAHMLLLVPLNQLLRVQLPIKVFVTPTCMISLLYFWFKSRKGICNGYSRPVVTLMGCNDGNI